MDIGKGWEPLANELLGKIQDFINTHPEHSDLEVTDIKEKFGALRVYLNYYPPGMSGLIREYEEKSLSVCELCGEKGYLQKKFGWYKTICDKCFEKWK
jgi:hypothetical protein